VSGLVGLLVVFNVMAAFLLTSRPIPAWLELHRFASDLDTAFMMGAVHIGLGSCVILFAARSLFRKHGMTTQLYVMGGVALFGLLLCLGRYWSYPVRQEMARPILTAPSEVPLHGVLPGGR
jgi:hypothetical protein